MQGIITPVFSGDADTVTVLKPESMGVIDGRQTWRMLVAFNLFYDYGPGGSFSQNYYATVYVVRYQCAGPSQSIGYSDDSWAADHLIGDLVLCVDLRWGGYGSGSCWNLCVLRLLLKCLREILKCIF